MFRNLFSLRPTHKAYWWKGLNGVSNFGDALAPLLLSHFAEIKCEWDTISHSSIASIGSILEHIPPLWDGYILGSGRLLENSRIHLHNSPAKILAVRGPLSARGLRGNFALGDPGLIANELVGYQEKKWDLGIMPHWQDKELAARFQKLIPLEHSRIVIDSADDPVTVLKQIASCKRMVTSSLHGMILSDAFSIPRRVEVCPAMERDGGIFKFKDYSASIQSTFTPGVMMEPHRFHVEDRQHEIYDAYMELKKALK